MDSDLNVQSSLQSGAVSRRVLKHAMTLPGLPGRKQGATLEQPGFVTYACWAQVLPSRSARLAAATVASIVGAYQVLISGGTMLGRAILFNLPSDPARIVNLKL